MQSVVLWQPGEKTQNTQTNSMNHVHSKCIDLSSSIIRLEHLPTCLVQRAAATELAS